MANEALKPVSVAMLCLLCCLLALLLAFAYNALLRETRTSKLNEEQ